MKASSIRDMVAAETKLPNVSRMMKNALFARLQQLKQGRLIVNVQGESLVFGQAKEDALLTARIDILDEALYGLIAEKGMVGCAEAYIHGMWKSNDLLNVIRLLAMNMDMAKQLDKKSLITKLMLHIYARVNANNIDGSKRNISAHYDLGNDFFELFLDRSMMYSSAIFKDQSMSLDDAAEYKLKMVCERLQLNSEDNVLEIGTGWGGLACYAAKNYGCKVVTTTISQEQYKKAQERVMLEGLQDKVTVLLQDYRLLDGKFDKLVSIEMIEAVGHEFYEAYFHQCSQLLKPNGLMLIQSILVSDQRYDFARKNVDFIKRYIFPGGNLPSYEVISRHVAQATDMNIFSVHDMTYDYAKTLACWRDRFFDRIEAVRRLGFTEEFIRLWEFYLCYCQAGFMERTIHTAQIVFAKPLWRDARYPQE